MNKKLFSWKALAGLTLLVAMGLTSCKQGNEIDPNDPTGSTKPVQPSVVDNKGADLTFTIKKANDINTLWASYDAAKKTELMKKTTLNVVINFVDFELDNATPLTLPKFMNTVANSLLNVTFGGNFKNADKQIFGLDLATNYSGAKANVKLPAGTYSMNLNAANVATTLTSDGQALVGALYGTADNVAANNALTIGSGVVINAIDDTFAGKIVKNGGDILGMIVNTQPVAAQFATKKGFTTLTSGSGFYTTNLIINAAGITITNDKDTPLGEILINKGCDLTLGYYPAKVSSITGTKASETKLTVAAAWDALKNIAAISNTTITNTLGFDITADVYEGVKFAEDVWAYTYSLDNIDFAQDVYIDFDADKVIFGFAACNFGDDIVPTGGIEKAVTPSKVTYQWDIDNKKWVVVTGALFPANAGDTGVEVNNWEVSVTAAGALVDPNNKVGDHKVFTIVTGASIWLAPENCGVVINDKCTTAGSAINDANINGLFDLSMYTKTWGVATAPWFDVAVGSDVYVWKKSSWGDYILTK